MLRFCLADGCEPTVLHSRVQVFSAISGSGNTTTLVLLVTELMGLYAISSLLLIRKQLPIKYR